MPSSYSTDLKLELMVTGENSGTWGDKTNTNLNLLQQAIAGYQDVSIAGGAQTTALVMTDATLSNARNAVIKFSGTITGNQIVTIPDTIEKTYILYNGTSGAFTVQFKTVSGTGPTFSTTDKGFKLVYSDGTNVTDVPLGVPGGSNTQIQFNNSGSFGGSANLTWDGTNVQIGATGALRFADTDSSNYVAFKSPGTVATNVTWTLPSADGTSNQVLTTNGSGTLSWSTPSGSGTVTSVDVSGGTTGLTTSGGPVTGSGTITLAGTLAVANGGTGQTSYTNGQLLIGNTTGNTLTKATLTAGSGISITNGSGSITIASTGGTGSNIFLANTFGAF